MMSAVASGATPPGQLIIYPQGTRVSPGDFKPYKIGVAALYQQTGQDCLPVACNVGSSGLNMASCVNPEWQSLNVCL